MSDWQNYGSCDICRTYRNCDVHFVEEEVPNYDSRETELIAYYTGGYDSKFDYMKLQTLDSSQLQEGDKKIDVICDTCVAKRLETKELFFIYTGCDREIDIKSGRYLYYHPDELKELKSELLETIAKIDERLKD